MEADENEGDKNLYLQSSSESSDEDQLKEDSHEYRRMWDKSWSSRNRNTIRSTEVEQRNQNGTEYRRSKRSTMGIKSVSGRCNYM